MVKNNKPNRMAPANSKYNAEFAAENTAADAEFGQEAAGMADSVGAANVGTKKGIVQKVKEADEK